MRAVLCSGERRNVAIFDLMRSTASALAPPLALALPIPALRELADRTRRSDGICG